MRVAVVAVETAYHDDSAATDRLRTVAQALAARGHDVTTFCAKWWGGSLSAFDAEGVTYRALLDGVAAPTRRLLTRLPSEIRRFDPDVIHAAHADPFAVQAASLAASLARTPLLVDWYEAASPMGRWRRGLWWLAARAPHAVVTPSRLVKTGVHQLGRPERGTRVIPTGIDMDRIRAIDPAPQGDIVYSRSLDDDANLESLLLGLAELRERAWEAVVIGDGPARAAAEAQAADLRIDDRVTFIGTQPLDRRLAIFKGAHVAVHTARRAPFAIDFLRALACGCVGIAEYHARSAATELIERRERGFRITTEAELARAIRDAGNHPRLAVDEDFASFDVDAVVDRYTEWYRNLA